MTQYIGIDNSSLDHKVRMIDEQGKLKLSITITNTFEGFEELSQKVPDLSDTKIGFESPHGPLVDYLRGKGPALYSLNPLKVKRFKESLRVSGNKNDDIDAHAIAEYLRMHEAYTRPLLFNSSEIERLKTLSIIHTRLTHEHARYINKLHFAVRQYFPLQEKLFSNFGCTVQLEMLRKYPTFDQLRAASDEEITEFLKQCKYRITTNIDKLLGNIRNHAQLISPDVEYAYRFEAKALCSIIESLKENLKEIEKEMKRITASHPLGRVFESLPGAGVVLAGKLLALFGDNRDRFNNYNAVQCLFGTAPRNYQSGPCHKVIMRKACNKSGRAVLFSYAFTSLRFSTWARRYYDMQREKGKTHSVAVRALSNKWVKVIYSLWKNEILYEESKSISPAA